ncbi:mitochondria-eating protein-like [Liolophura sinensis]|uniref:mitochondria-eating protein-like n=1 Tax=Liolophura sinensis TaxID=3198878 RepID=UPI003158C375
MSESLRRLVNIGSFRILQDKLDRWYDDYNINTCDQNVAACCEIVELNSKVQGQLFKILSLTASEGGTYAGADIIKYRLLPWLGQNFFTSGSSYSSDSLAETAAKNRELDQLQEMYENSLQRVEEELKLARAEVEDLKDELADANDELIKLRALTGRVDTYKSQIRSLKDDLLVNSFSSSKLSRDNSYHYASRSSSVLSLDDPVQRVRQHNLISRFNDMFAQDRLDAMDTLRRYSDDHENNQRILFSAIYEAFSVAKLAFRQFKMKVRANLAATHIGPETLEEAVQDYINRNTDLYDLPGMVSDVIRSLNRNIKIFLPLDTSFAIIQPYIREACKLAWQMSALAHPLDIKVASDAELYDDMSYRRSYDSEYTAPLVNHHVWPCLVQGSKVLMKGEAVTRRGASLGSSRRPRSPTSFDSPSRSRSMSRGRSASPSARSRSLSPRRSTSPFRR